jgi:uncharacterized membrane protein YecN with MAPEG domain
MGEGIVLPVTVITTVICLGLSIWSDMRIGKARQAVKRGRADAPPILAARQGAAAAFRGSVLFFLILLGLLELAGAAGWLLVAACAAFVSARATLIARSDDDRGALRAATVTVSLFAQLAMAVYGLGLAIDFAV